MSIRSAAARSDVITQECETSAVPRSAGSEPAAARPAAVAAPPLAPAEPGALYAPARRIYPQSVSGRFRRIKWAVLVVTLGIYYLLPFVRWDRGPGAPSQAVLIDFPGRRFYFFFIEIWPQEVYYITGLLILAAMTLFLMNAVAGRIWCGYLCPQTVWTDLFLQIERLIEGDRRERMRLDAEPWTLRKVVLKATKHFLWLMVAWWTGGAWVLYFADAPTLVKALASGEAPFIAYAWIGILTFTTYFLAGHMREQVCTYMCPWPRIQAALTDEYALNVTYRYDRGEPRGSIKKNALLRQQGLPAGDCVDCLQCVHVCPTGVDIRKGLQLDCIQCGLCIDACDAVMNKIGRPPGLIGYDTELNIQRRLQGQPPIFKPVRTRTVLYAAIIAVVGLGMLYSLAVRSTVGVSVIHDRNPVFVQLSDGGIRNAYTIRILNKALEARSFLLMIEGLLAPEIEVIGSAPNPDGQFVLEVGPDQTREVRALVTVHRPPPSPSTPVTFRVIEMRSGEHAKASDHFRAP
ncbi:MAG: cytochrome c oxidase accessory protein CcoG [Variibacter sp.]|nr:cytochrome c oxidase accessory protein CcoG [Variibacter sp.]